MSTLYENQFGVNGVNLSKKNMKKPKVSSCFKDYGEDATLIEVKSQVKKSYNLYKYAQLLEMYISVLEERLSKADNPNKYFTR